MQMRFSSVLFMLVLATNAQAQELLCTIAQKYVCEATGCKPSTPTVWNRIDLAKETYARCERNDCDTYQARITRSGVFINIELSGRNTMARLVEFDVPLAELRALSFHEVVTEFHTVVVSFGSCERG